RRGADPSSISRSIAALEDELKVRLFQRNTRRLTPTEAGTVYFDRVEPLVDELDRAHLAAAEAGETPVGTLRITAPVSFAQLNIVPLLPEFSRRYPELAFDLLLTDTVLDLVAERIDVAIRLGPLADTGLIAQRLTPMIGRVCATPGYLAARGRPASPEDLQDHNCLLLDHLPGFDSKWRFVKDGRRFEVPVRGTIRSSNALALKQCALAGMGVILQALWVVGRELKEGVLIDVFPGYSVTAANFPSPAAWALYPSRTYVPLKVRVFLNYLKAQFHDESPWERT
ncbi:MAG: LysR family transcriptional regulator, partial [Candidatus Eremiobacteraeota bacterium]|nr:LysR family transcriptional regulator [Candidatus Eremiobacteraeota bacterium]